MELVPQHLVPHHDRDPQRISSANELGWVQLCDELGVRRLRLGQRETQQEARPSAAMVCVGIH